MKKTPKLQQQKEKKTRPKATATFQVELPVEVDEHQARLLAAHEQVFQRAKEGQVLPQSLGVPRAGARRADQSKRPFSRASDGATASVVAQSPGSGRCVVRTPECIRGELQAPIQ